MVARLTGGEEVAGSNPVVPTILPASGQVGAEVSRSEGADHYEGPRGRLILISPDLNREACRGPDTSLRREYPPVGRGGRDARLRPVRIPRGPIPHGNQIPAALRSRTLMGPRTPARRIRPLPRYGRHPRNRGHPPRDDLP